MDLDYIAGFFDGEGNLHISRVGSLVNGLPKLQIRVRFYQKNREILNIIKNYLKFGTIYENRGLFELTIYRKEEVKAFLEMIKDKVYLKREQVKYILTNFHFEDGNNAFFDIEKFRKPIIRKNVLRKLKTPQKK
jgi:hypothetical protein